MHCKTWLADLGLTTFVYLSYPLKNNSMSPKAFVATDFLRGDGTPSANEKSDKVVIFGK
jgi:hypothetical protein